VIDLMDVVDDIRERKLGFPCVVRSRIAAQPGEAAQRRVPQRDRAARVQGAVFRRLPDQGEPDARGGRGDLDAGAPWHFGLEAGSKGELLIVLAMNTDPKRSPSATATRTRSTCGSRLMGRKLGRKMLVVIEKLSELPHCCASRRR